MNDGAPPIEDYAFLSDGAGGALVSRDGSIDWCCLPRLDHGACFARLLGWERGGFWRIGPRCAGAAVSRRYLDGTLVLETRFTAGDGEVRLLDFLFVDPDQPDVVHGEVVRIAEGVRGAMDLDVLLQARFDFGEVRPWRRSPGHRVHQLVGGDDGLQVSGTVALAAVGDHD